MKAVKAHWVYLNLCRLMAANFHSKEGPYLRITGKNHIQDSFIICKRLFLFMP